MKITIFTAAFMAATAFAAPLARRAVAFTNDFYFTAVGTPLTINWAGASGAVTINLKSGAPDNLQTTGTVASNIWDTSTTWTPFTAGTYALEIIDSSGAVNYSPPFWVGERSEPSLAKREPRFSLSRWLLDQPQLSKAQRIERQRITSQHDEHLTRRDDAGAMGRPTETENMLKDFAMKKDLMKLPDWRQTLFAPVNALSRAIAPWNAVSSKADNMNKQGKPAPVTEVVGPKEVVVTKGPGAGQVEIEESPRAGESFTQGYGWKGDNYRHGTWTSKSKDAGKNHGQPEQGSTGEVFRRRRTSSTFKNHAVKFRDV